MNKVKMVIDNFFDDLYLHQLFEKVVNIPIYGNNVANRKTWPYGFEGSHRLFGNMLFCRQSLNNVTILHDSAKDFFEIFENIEDRIFGKKVYLNNIQLNVQTEGMDGSCHMDSYDPEEVTVLFMVNPKWEKSWGGEFQILDNESNVLEEYDYKPGRLIAFPANVPHRGLSPKEKDIIRYSIVFRIGPIQKYI